MKYTIASLFLAALVMGGCASLPDIKGPYAKSTSTRSDAAPEQVERSPFPEATDQGLF